MIFNSVRRINFVQRIVFGHNGMKLEINLQKAVWGSHKHVEIKQQTVSNQQLKEEITREFRKYFEVNENKDTPCQNLWKTAKSVLRVKFIAKSTDNLKEDLKLTI